MLEYVSGFSISSCPLHGVISQGPSLIPGFLQQRLEYSLELAPENISGLLPPRLFEQKIIWLRGYLETQSRGSVLSGSGRNPVSGPHNYLQRMWVGLWSASAR